MMKFVLFALMFFFAANAEAAITCSPIQDNPLIEGTEHPIGRAIQLNINCKTNISGARLYYLWTVDPAVGEIVNGTNPRAKLVVEGPSEGTDVTIFIQELGLVCETQFCRTVSFTRELKGSGKPCWLDGNESAVTCMNLDVLNPDGTPRNSKCDEQCHKGNPVNVTSGSMWHENTDFVLKGRTPDSTLELRRSYTANSATRAGDFGPNWRHAYETSLQVDFSTTNQKSADGKKLSPLDRTLLWIDENGGPWRFRYVGNPVYESPPSLNATLTQMEDHFELRKENGTILYFSKGVTVPDAIGQQPQRLGKLYKIKDVYGEEINFTFGTKGLDTAYSPMAGTVRFLRDSSNRVTEVIRERDNLHYYYAYEGGRLTSVTDFAGRVYRYGYNPGVAGSRASRMMSSIIDPLGREIRFTYYSDGRAHQQFEPGGGVWTFKYGDGFSEVTSPDGATTKYSYDQNYRVTQEKMPDGARRYSTYDLTGRLAETYVDTGGKTRYQYDNQGNLSAVKRPLDPSATQIINDPLYNKPTQVTPLVGAPTSYSLNPETGDVMAVSRGNLTTTYTRDAFGNILATNNGVATYSDQRDSHGRLTVAFDAHNPQTFQYDSRNRLTQRSFLSGRTITYTYDNDDRLVRTDDSHGPSVINTYDIMGKLLERNVTKGGESQITKFAYDDRDRLTAVTDALNHTTTYQYDSVRIMDKPISITDALGRVTQFRYDIKQRLVEKIDAKGASTKFTYDAEDRMTSVTDALGNKTTYAYNANGDKIRESRPSIAGTTAARYVMEYFYDLGARLTKIRKPSVRPGIAKETIYQYDELDRMIGRVLQIRNGGQVAVEDNSTYAYEPIYGEKLLTEANNQVAQLGFSRVGSPPYSISSYTVDATQSGNPLGLIAGEFTLGRDVTGEISSVTSTIGNIFTRAYDPAGRLTSALAGPLQVNLAYDLYGRKKSQAFSTGETGDFTYDLLNRITSVSWTGPSPASQQLTYDELGDVISVARENGSHEITYDELGRIVSSSDTGSIFPYTRVFGYDSLGNRVSASPNDTLSTFVSNFLISNGVSSFTADADGHGEVVQEATGNQVKNYTYRADGKISGFQSGNLSVDYYYDGLDRLVAKAVNKDGTAFTNSFTYLGSENRVLLGKAGDGSVTTYIDGQGISQRLGEVKSGVGKGYITDHLGSVLNSPVAGSSKSYGLFGEVNASVALSPTSSPVMYGWQGLAYDAATGQWDNLARQYDQKTGRFTSQDPSGLQGGINLYGSRNNNPLKFVDLKGRSPEDVAEIERRYQQRVNEMTAAGERNIDPATNNWRRTLYNTTWGYAGDNYKGCGEQAIEVQLRVDSNKYDDQWNFEVKGSDLPGEDPFSSTGYRLGPHYWVEGTSSNPRDPKVVLDPWRNQSRQETR